MSIPQGGRHDLRINQGASFSVVFYAREQDETTAVALTGYTARSQVRRSRGAADLMLEFTCAVDEDDGSITLSATAEETGALTSSGVYDVELSQAGEVVRFVEGRVYLDREVTEDPTP